MNLKNKEYNVIMLSTDKGSELISNYGTLLLDNRNLDLDGEVVFKHLYILSNEKIYKGWKGVAYKKDVVGQVFNHKYTTNKWYDDAQIVVASTDPSLGLPLIPNSFLTQYVEAFNKNTPIIRVALDTENRNTKIKITPNGDVVIYAIIKKNANIDVTKEQIDKLTNSPYVIMKEITDEQIKLATKKMDAIIKKQEELILKTLRASKSHIVSHKLLKDAKLLIGGLMGRLLEVEGIDTQDKFYLKAKKFTKKLEKDYNVKG
jgi:hypothetical protein